MKKHLYLIRHGVTNHIANNIQQPPTAELSAHGHAQARALAARFASRAHATSAETERGAYTYAYASSGPDFYIEHLASSPYTRAQETAQAVAERTSLTCETLEFVHERILPTALDNTPVHDPVRVEMLDAIFKQWAENPSVRITDEETFNELSARVRKLQDYIASHSATHIAVVSHATYIKTFLATVYAANEQSPNVMWSLYHSHDMANTGVSEFTYDDEKGWRVVTWNDRAHLFHLSHV